jgi:CHASE3 domain sensor protein
MSDFILFLLGGFLAFGIPIVFLWVVIRLVRYFEKEIKKR